MSRLGVLVGASPGPWKLLRLVGEADLGRSEHGASSGTTEEDIAPVSPSLRLCETRSLVVILGHLLVAAHISRTCS